MKDHVELGVKVLKRAQFMLKNKSKGSYRTTSFEEND